MAMKALSVMLATFAMLSIAHARAAANDTGTEKIIERSDLSATLYMPGDGKRHPALLILGGAEGGRDWTDAVAKRLSQDGYIAMAQSYFKDPGLPDQLQRIPLERFQAAVDYLINQPAVEKHQIAVIGLSKGAEAALVLASHDPRLTAVASLPRRPTWSGRASIAGEVRRWVLGRSTARFSRTFRSSPALIARGYLISIEKAVPPGRLIHPQLFRWNESTDRY